MICALLLPAAKLSAAGAKRDFRAVWVATVFNLDYPSKKGLTSEQMKAEADAILDRAK